MKTYFKVEGTYSKQEYEDKARRLLEIDIINKEDYSRVLNSKYTQEYHSDSFTDFFYSENAKNYTVCYIDDLKYMVLTKSFETFYTSLVTIILQKQGLYELKTEKKEEETIFHINNLTYSLSWTTESMFKEICRFIESINFEERKICKQASTTDSIIFLVLSKSQYEIMYNERLVCFDNEYYPEIEEWRKNYVPPF
ncbi:hypothetical protein V9L05_21225 [Bernardetia sp. Wsw4-3y2]|uniref:hypothetical protein n=1 Tax=Bernardetia sp. Wsw4-3y2 TaxID=3127471 RepID=UPI0030CED816